MRFFKNRKISVSVGDLPRNRNDAFRESLDYFGSSRDVVHANIYNREKVLLNRFAKGELSCSTEELDIKLNKEVISDNAVRKYEIDDASFALTDAVWFPRLRTKRVTKKVDEGIGLNSRTSSEEELYDGFSGPWSWETSSLQEMGFPPTPELEPKSKSNASNTKKSKRKKKLTVTGDEEVDDIRTFETLDELRARLKANYIEAKEQREKYLNLKQEQTEEERRAKSVRGNRDKLKQQDKNDKYAKNETKGGILSSFRTKKEQGRPFVAKREPPSKQTFDSELADAVRRNGSVPALDDIPDSPSLPRNSITPSSLSPSSARASPSKPLLMSSSSSGSDLLLTKGKASKDKDESFDHISLTDINEYLTINNDSKTPAPTSNVISNANSNVSITVSSENDSASSPPKSELVRRNSSKKRSKKGLSRESSQKSIKGSPAKSPARSPTKSPDRASMKRKDEEETTKTSFDMFGSSLINYDTASSTIADEDDANESVIKNDNNYEITGGLGNVMDMLSNW